MNGSVSVQVLKLFFSHLMSYSSLALRPVTLIFNVGNILLKIQSFLSVSQVSGERGFDSGLRENILLKIQCVLSQVWGERGCFDSGLRETRLRE